MCGMFINAGQICSATSRLILQDSVYDRFMEKLITETRKLKLGDPFDESTKVGPLVSSEQLEKVSGFVRRALEDGAQAVQADGALPSCGHFYQPTILTGLQEHSEA